MLTDVEPLSSCDQATLLVPLREQLICMESPPPQVAGAIMRAVQADSVLRGLEKHNIEASTPWPGLLSCSHFWLTAQVRGDCLSGVGVGWGVRKAQMIL